MLNGFAIMDFDTKIAIAVRDDLAVWQKLNVTAFITSGIIGQHGLCWVMNMRMLQRSNMHPY